MRWRSSVSPTVDRVLPVPGVGIRSREWEKPGDNPVRLGSGRVVGLREPGRSACALSFKVPIVNPFRQVSE